MMSAHHRVAPRTLRLSLLALGALLQLGAAKCPGRSQAPARTARPALPDSAEQALYGLNGVLNASGQVRGTLRANVAYVYDDGGRLELRQVTATFVGAAGDSISVLTAREGTFDARRSRLVARGGVTVVTPAGRRLQTEHAVFDVTRNLLSGDSAYTAGGSSGVGFEADPRLARVRPPTKAAPASPARGTARRAASGR